MNLIPSIIVPFNNTKHTLKFLNNGWHIGNSIRMGLKSKRIYVDLIFKKAKPEIKEDGKVLGVDLGYRSLLATSEGQLIGTELKNKVEKVGKCKKRFHYYIQTEANRLLKTLNLDDIKTLIIVRI